MASNLERKWRQLLVSNSDDSSKRMDIDSAEGRSCQSVRAIDTESDDRPDTKGKKRKAEAPSKAAPPAKKATTTSTAIASSSSSKTAAPSAKKEAKLGAEVKNAKSDSSFFSAPKPKPKLPSFKKAPAPVKKEPEPNVAQPSNFNPFEEALKSMRPRKGSPMVSTPPPAPPPAPSASTTVAGSAAIAKNDKAKKSVTWAPEGKLELIKLIERAVYDDDPQDVSSLFLLCLRMYFTLITRLVAPIHTGYVYLAQPSRS